MCEGVQRLYHSLFIFRSVCSCVGVVLFLYSVCVCAAVSLLPVRWRCEIREGVCFACVGGGVFSFFDFLLILAVCWPPSCVNGDANLSAIASTQCGNETPTRVSILIVCSMMYGCVWVHANFVSLVVDFCRISRCRGR